MSIFLTLQSVVLLLIHPHQYLTIQSIRLESRTALVVALQSIWFEPRTTSVLTAFLLSLTLAIRRLLNVRVSSSYSAKMLV